MKINLHCLAIIAGLLITTAHARGELISSIAAVVNDEVITSLDVDREILQMRRETARITPSLQQPPPAELRDKALNRLIDKKLVELKVKELNIKVTEEELRQAIEDVKKQNNISQENLVAALAAQGLSYDQYRQQVREQLERLHLMTQEVRSKIQVGEREVQEYYQANLATYREEEQYHARHILFKTKGEGKSEEVARAMALKVLAEARAGKDFAELARVYSDDPAAAKDGGDLGKFRKSDMLPEIAAVVTTMKPGDISELVSSGTGFHIIRLEEVIPARVKPFEQVRGEIEEVLFRKKTEERFSQWAEELRKGAAIEIRGTGSVTQDLNAEKKDLVNTPRNEVSPPSPVQVPLSTAPVPPPTVRP